MFVIHNPNRRSGERERFSLKKKFGPSGSLLMIHSVSQGGVSLLFCEKIFSKKNWAVARREVKIGFEEGTFTPRDH